MSLHVETLLLAAITIRAAFVLIFAANAYKRRKQTYLLLWFASPVFAVVALLVAVNSTTFPMISVFEGALIFGLLGFGFSLCLSGLRSLLGRPQTCRRVILQGLAPATIYALLVSIGDFRVAWAGSLAGLTVLAAWPVAELLPVFLRDKFSSQFFVLLGFGYYAAAFGLAAWHVASGIAGAPLEQMLLPVFAADSFFSVLLLVNFLAITGERARQSLRELATRDKLTGLLNRRGFVEVTGKALTRSADHPLATFVLMADIDHFKSINDRFGHDAGDVVLAEFGRRCRTVIQHPGDLAARWGGEEFAIFLSETTADEALSLAEKLRHSIAAAPFLVFGVYQKITVSTGVASIEIGETNVEPGLGRADIALYEAKHSGRNRVRLARLAESPPLQPADDRRPVDWSDGDQAMEPTILEVSDSYSPRPIDGLR